MKLIIICAVMSFLVNTESWSDYIHDSIGAGGGKSIRPRGGMSLDNPKALNPDKVVPYGW